MFLDNINQEEYLTEAYAKGKMASDYIAKIRQKCALMTYVPGFTKTKIKRLENLIETYEDKLKLAKEELADYRNKSKEEKEKIERLNKVDTILSTSIKVAVVILSVYISYVSAAKLAPKIAGGAKKVVDIAKLVANAEKVSKVKRIIAKICGFTANKIMTNASTVAKISNANKIASGTIKSVKYIEHGSDTIKIGGYEAEIVKCIREMEMLLDVLKKKKTMFEMEIEKRERGIR